MSGSSIAFAIQGKNGGQIKRCTSAKRKSNAVIAFLAASISCLYPGWQHGRSGYNRYLPVQSVHHREYFDPLAIEINPVGRFANFSIEVGKIFTLLCGQVDSHRWWGGKKQYAYASLNLFHVSSPWCNYGCFAISFLREQWPDFQQALSHPAAAVGVYFRQYIYKISDRSLYLWLISLAWKSYVHRRLR